MLETPTIQQSTARSRASEDLKGGSEPETAATIPHGSFSGRSRRAGHEWTSAAALVLLDAVCWVSIYGLATFMRGGTAFYATPLQFAVVEAVQFAVLLTALFIVGGYNHHTEMRGLAYGTEHVLAVLGAAAGSSLLVYSAATFDQTMKPSRGVLLLSFALFLPVSLGYRRLLRNVVSASTATRAFLVIGSGKLAAEFYSVYKKAGNRQRLEFVDTDQRRVGEHIGGAGSPIIEGDLATKLDRLDETYSGVVLAERIDQLHPDLLERLVRTQFQRARVYTLESFHEAHWRHVPIHSLDPFWPLQMGFQLARNSPYHYLKRLFDIAGSSVLLLLTAPFFAAIAVAIWKQDGGPVIFRQTRVGRDDEPFTIYKFRTMFTRTEDAAGDIYTRREDPRITGVGRTLRKLRLDELPQLWNVFRGEMSLIGPRAEWIKCAERYEEVIPFYHFRHLVKPGITGWAQVNYPYGESDQDAIEKLKYDLYYIRKYSLKLDVMIAIKTIHTILFGKGQ